MHIQSKYFGTCKHINWWYQSYQYHETNSKTNLIGNPWWRWCSPFVWCPQVDFGAVSASPWGSATKARWRRRSSWTPCVLTSSSTQRCARMFLKCGVKACEVSTYPNARRMTHTAWSSNSRCSGQSHTSFSRLNFLCECAAPMLLMRSSLATCRGPLIETLRGTGLDMRYAFNACWFPRLMLLPYRGFAPGTFRIICSFFLRCGVTNGPTCRSTILGSHCWMTANMATLYTRTRWPCPCEVPTVRLQRSYNSVAQNLNPCV